MLTEINKAFTKMFSKKKLKPETEKQLCFNTKYNSYFSSFHTHKDTISGRQLIPDEHQHPRLSDSDDRLSAP